MPLRVAAPIKLPDVVNKGRDPGRMFLKSRPVQLPPRGTHAEPEEGSPAVEEGESPNPSKIGSTGYGSEGLG
jgi:hypothetical protein